MIKTNSTCNKILANINKHIQSFVNYSHKWFVSETIYLAPIFFYLTIMTKNMNVTVDPRPLDNAGNPQAIPVQHMNPPSYPPPSYDQGSYPPPQHSYPPQQPGIQQQNLGWSHQTMAPPNTVIITNPVVVQPSRQIVVQVVGHNPFMVTCPNCNMQVRTRIDTHTSMTQHLWALALCMIG